MILALNSGVTLIVIDVDLVMVFPLLVCHGTKFGTKAGTRLMAFRGRGFGYLIITTSASVSIQTFAPHDSGLSGL